MNSSTPLDQVLRELRKLSKLVGILVTKDLPAGEAVSLLNRSTFTPTEIGDTLGKSGNLVNSILYLERQKLKSANGKKGVDGKTSTKSKNTGKTKQ